MQMKSVVTPTAMPTAVSVVSAADRDCDARVSTSSMLAVGGTAGAGGGGEGDGDGGGDGGGGDGETDGGGDGKGDGGGGGGEGGAEGGSCSMWSTTWE